MALKDLIAQAGLRNFELVRRGFAPTPEERQARQLKDLQIKTKKSDLDYAPTKRKMAKDEQAISIKYRESLLAKHKFDIDTKKDALERSKYAYNQKVVGRHLKSAIGLNSVTKQKKYLTKFSEEIYDAGNAEADTNFKALLGMNGNNFRKNLKLAMKGNQFLQDLTEDRIGKTTTVQNLDSGDLRSIRLNDENHQQKLNDYIAKDYIVVDTPKVNQQGTASSFGLGGDKKSMRDLMGQKTAIQVANYVGKNTIKALTDNPEALSTTGGFARLASGLKSQINGAATLMGTKWKLGTSFDPDSYDQLFQKAGINNVIIRGNMTQLARMLATAAGESKVLSNQDMKRWLNAVAADSGSPEIVTAAIRSALNTQNKRFRLHYKNIRGVEFEGDLGMPSEADPNIEASSFDVDAKRKEFEDIERQLQESQ